MDAKTITTALPVNTNAGKTTRKERATFFETLKATSVEYSTIMPCEGYWYDSNGSLHKERVIIVEMKGDESAIKSAVIAFGSATEQSEMLYVENTRDHIIARGNRRKEAAALAKEHGGSTLLPDGSAIVYKYNALVRHIDYE